MARGIADNASNAVLIKLNQIGTLSETLDTMGMTAGNGRKAIVSHRNGGTPDRFVAYLVVGINIDRIRTGSLPRSGRIEKDDWLLVIADHAGETARFPGTSALLANPMSAGSDAVFKGLTSIHFSYILRD